MKNMARALVLGMLLVACEQWKENRLWSEVWDEWKELDCGLWINQNGLLALKTKRAKSDTSYTVHYITRINWNDSTLLSDVIDTNSFQHLGGAFFKDRNHVYCHYTNSDGGYLYQWKTSPDSFEVLGDCYAKDSFRIYYERGSMDSVDYTSFQTVEGLGCIAKDQHGYIFWNERMRDLSKYGRDEVVLKFEEALAQQRQ